MTAHGVEIDADASFVLVVSVEPLDATSSLFFTHLEVRSRGALRVVTDRDRRLPALLARASAVVVVRALFELPALTRAATAVRVPLYYFVDDNFMVLREHGGVEAQFVEQYSLEAVRAALERFAGVLLASPALVDYFVSHELHHNLRLFPPVASLETVASPPSTRIRVAFFGGQHLHGVFHDTIVPAVRRLARGRAVTLIAVGMPDRIEPSEGLSVVQLPYDVSYSRGVAALAAEGVDLLVHPVALGLANNVYKNPHALITAHALGAVPVVSDAPPYDRLGADGPALRCGESEDAWFDTLERAAGDPELRAEVGRNLAGYCQSHFNGRANLEMLGEIARRHPAPSRPTAWARREMARAVLFSSRMGRVAARARRGDWRSGVRAS